MKIKKYTILKNNLIFKGIKYEVGKRYKKIHYLFMKILKFY